MMTFPMNYLPSVRETGKNIFVGGFKAGMIGYAFAQVFTYIRTREFLDFNPTRFIVIGVIRRTVIEIANCLYWLGEKALGDRDKSIHLAEPTMSCLKLRHWTWKAINCVEDYGTTVLSKVDQRYSKAFGIRRAKEVENHLVKDMHTTEVIRRLFWPTLKQFPMAIISTQIGIRGADWLLKSATIVALPTTLGPYLLGFALFYAVNVGNELNIYRIQCLKEYYELYFKQYQTFTKDHYTRRASLFGDLTLDQITTNLKTFEDWNAQVQVLKQSFIDFGAKWKLYPLGDVAAQIVELDVIQRYIGSALLSLMIAEQRRKAILLKQIEDETIY